MLFGPGRGTRNRSGSGFFLVDWFVCLFFSILWLQDTFTFLIREDNLLLKLKLLPNFFKKLVSCCFFPLKLFSFSGLAIPFFSFCFSIQRNHVLLLDLIFVRFLLPSFLISFYPFWKSRPFETVMWQKWNVRKKKCEFRGKLQHLQCSKWRCSFPFLFPYQLFVFMNCILLPFF